MRGALVIEKAKKKFPEAKAIQESTFSQYLSESARDPKSKINTRGRWKGYYLAEVVDEIPSQEMSPEEEADTEQGPSRTQKEKLLYKVLEDWLIEQGYQARDISNVRSLGPWGNPDIVGILPIKVAHTADFEVIGCVPMRRAYIAQGSELRAELSTLPAKDAGGISDAL